MISVTKAPRGNHPEGKNGGGVRAPTLHKMLY